MKFNMGCGHNRLDGYVNVDAFAEAQPDEVVDLEMTPWPWADNCATEVRFIHSLEHMGADPKVFLAIMTELYRICAPDAKVVIWVPHPRHDDFIGDPTHVRVVTPQVLSLFDRDQNDAWKAAGNSNTPLAHYMGVDFRLTGTTTVLAEPYASRMQSGEMNREDLREALSSKLNVARELRMELTVRK